MPYPPSLRASLEAMIYRGSSPLFRALTRSFTDALEGDERALVRIGSVIRDHTKLAITFEPMAARDYDAFILVPIINANHVLNGLDAKEVKTLVDAPSVQKDFEALRKHLDGQKGSVDGRGVAHGVFTKIGAELNFSKAFLDGAFSAEECAAVTLHEIGHLYTSLDAMWRTTSVSILIEETAQAILKEPDPTKRVALMDARQSVFTFKDGDRLDASAIAQDAHPDETYRSIQIRNFVDALANQVSPRSVYNAEGEFEADAFAVRHGAGRYLASALAKIYRAAHHVQTLSTGAIVATGAMNVALGVVLALYPPALAVAGLATGLYLASQRQATIYRNTPVERLESIHNDLVAILKDRKLTRAQAQDVLEEIKFVDGLRATLTERPALTSLIWRAISPATRLAYRQERFQRDVSQFVNNDLFIRAAELRELSGSIKRR